MSSPSVAATQRPFRASRALVNLGGFVGFGLALSSLYAAAGIGFGCPFKLLTGWDCPLCGGTRLGSSLLHGDLVTAFWFNPLVFVGLVVVAGLGALWTIEVFGGPRVRLPERINAVWRRVSPTRWLLTGLVLAIVYTLLRNLL